MYVVTNLLQYMKFFFIYILEPSQALSIENFTGSTAQPCGLGLDHINKAPKRTRYAYTEKAIKIHN